MLVRLLVLALVGATTFACSRARPMRVTTVRVEDDATQLRVLQAVLHLRVRELSGPALLSPYRMESASAMHDSVTLAALAPEVLRILPAEKSKVLDTAVIEVSRAVRQSLGDYYVTTSLSYLRVTPKGCVAGSGNTANYIVRCTSEWCIPRLTRKVFGAGSCEQQ